MDVPHPNGSGEIVPLQIHCQAGVPENDRSANVRVNIERKTIRFLSLPGLLGERKEPVAIVGGGPSLKYQLPKIREFKQILAAGSSHDFLVENGIIPTFALVVDPADNTADYYKHPQENTSYLIASQCHPSVFERIEPVAKDRIAMWHFKDQIDDKSVFKGENEICWGCMVGIVAIQIALFLGFQHHHYFGMDCSYEGDDTHSYPLGETEHKFIWGQRIEADVGSKRFLTTTALVMQASQFFDVYESSDGEYLKGTVYGDGMLAEIIRNSPPEMSEWLQVA